MSSLSKQISNSPYFDRPQTKAALTLVAGHFVTTGTSMDGAQFVRMVESAAGQVPGVPDSRETVSAKVKVFQDKASQLVWFGVLPQRVSTMYADSRTAFSHLQFPALGLASNVFGSDVPYEDAELELRGVARHLEREFHIDARGMLSGSVAGCSVRALPPALSASFPHFPQFRLSTVIYLHTLP